MNLIAVVSLMFLLVNYLNAWVPNPDFNPNEHPPSQRTWFPEQIHRIVEFIQPDGIVIEFEEYTGGENNPYIMFRMNEFTIVWDRESGYWCFARQSHDGNLESTGYPVHLYNPEELGLEKNIRMSEERAKDRRRNLLNNICGGKNEL